MKNSAIEWTDHTFNPWEGCTKVSPGCLHCYAEARNVRFAGGANWGKGAPRRRTSIQNWHQPRSWNRLQETSGAVHHGAARPRVFCASLADWLDDEVPIEWLADLLRLIHETPNLDWLLLSKRPQNWDKRVGAACSRMSPLGPYAATKRWLFEWLGGLERENHRTPSNVWIGTTVEDQARADERIPILCGIPARVRFLSCEPLLEDVLLGLRGILPNTIAPTYTPVYERIHWVIAGGESGRGARPMLPQWARSLRDQCAEEDVAFHFKQWGGENKKATGRLLDGREHNALPNV